MPLEAILNHNNESLQAVKAAIERERLALIAQQQRIQAPASAAPVQGAQDAAMGEAPGSHAAPAARSSPAQSVPVLHIGSDSGISLFKDDFDSGAESEIEEGSQVTVMSESD